MEFNNNIFEKPKIVEPGIFSSALLLLTNINDEIIYKKYKLLDKVSNHHTAYILFHSKSKDENVKFKKIVRMFPFTNDILVDSGYKALGVELVPGNNHFPLLKFYLENPSYDFYWIIEDDVHYNDNWQVFFDFFLKLSSADFISSHIYDFNENPNWYWWNTLFNSKKTIIQENRVRSFNPIYRLSNRALNYLNKQLKDGWQGHHEVVIPTLLKEGGFIIQDFGGTGGYVAQNCENLFYKKMETSQLNNLFGNSMRFKPNINHEEMTENILYHPVKNIR